MNLQGYDVLGRVAEGSTGVVWQARQLELGRLVAIKELSSVLLSTPGFLDRFRAEAQTLASLDDPHVVRLYEYIEEPSRALLIQEWVEGAPLAAVLERHGRLSPEQSLGVLRGGLIGLGHAHDRSLVHRDISPTNILLDQGGVSKLVDFGLAARSGQGSDPGVGSSVGTPAFSSPEAVTGQPMTARSDVYSAAAVLYLLLSGRLPYAGDMQAVLQAHVAAPVPALSGFAPRLTDLLRRAMAKRPEERPADAAAFLAELEEAARDAYGAGWLSRASVAGLATAVAGAGSVAAVGGAGVPAAAQALAYGTAGTPAALAGAQTPSAGAVGARVLGIPRVALMVASAVVVVAVAATAFALTRSSDEDPVTAGADSTQTQGRDDDPTASVDSTTTAPTTTTAASTTPPPPPIPAVSGVYDVLLTYTGAEGVTADDVAVGDVQNVTWTVTSTCPSGPCDFNVVSSSGRTYTYAYVGGTWQRSDAVPSECFDQNGAGAPTGVTITLSVEATLQSDAPFDPSLGAPLSKLTGTGSDTTDSDCDGNPATYTYSLVVTSTGD